MNALIIARFNIVGCSMILVFSGGRAARY